MPSNQPEQGTMKGKAETNEKHGHWFDSLFVIHQHCLLGHLMKGIL